MEEVIGSISEAKFRLGIQTAIQNHSSGLYLKKDAHH